MSSVCTFVQPAAARTWPLPPCAWQNNSHSPASMSWHSAPPTFWAYDMRPSRAGPARQLTWGSQNATAVDRSSEASWPIEYSPEFRAPARTPGAQLARGQFLQPHTPSPGSNHSRSVEARKADGGSPG
ncbi:hypothetical protein OH77DRAFT_1429062 [Trametes cingulata]|nr:hypothetical protein OH77DRAFT_1429062 [Trametes cingulata]